MGFELPNGKTARNLQDQVKFLSEKLKDLYAAFNNSGLKKIEIVEELPEVGDPTVLYLLAKEDPEEGDYYDEYLWYDNQWEQIGTTQIDLSDYCTLSTEQTITAEKTIKDAALALENSNLSNRCWKIFEDEWGTLIFSIEISGTETKYYSFQSGCFVPLNNYQDLGANNAAQMWRDLYLSGKTLYKSGSQVFSLGANEWNGLDLNRTGSTILSFGGSDFSSYSHKPLSNNTYDLGASGTAWKDLYVSGNSASTGIHIGNGLLAYNSGFRFDAAILPDINGSRSIGGPSTRWADLYLSGNISDGTYSATVEALVKKARLYTHTIICSNGTLVLIGSFSASITSQSSLSMASSSALKMEWEGNTVLKIVNGTTIYYFDSSDSTIKSTTIGTFTSDSIMDY